MSNAHTYPYPNRPGIFSESLDFEAGQQILGPEVLDDVVAFEHQLYAASLDADLFPSAESYRLDKEQSGYPIESLETIWQRKVNSTDLGVNYFAALNPAEAPGGAIDARALSTLDISTMPPEELDELEAKSVGYEEAKVTTAFIENGYNGEGVDGPDIITIYKNPEAIAQKGRGYRALKTYIRHAMDDLSNNPLEDPQAQQAKLLVADLYQKRLNILLADVYVDAYKLLRQHQRSGGQAHGDVVAELQDVLPAFFDRDDVDRNAYFLQRMDRFRNGVVRDKQDKLTWLSPQASELADRSHNVQTDTAEIDRGIYSDIDPAELRTTRIDGETFGIWVESVLNEYDLLSEDRDWNSEREGPAADNKWQVVVNDKFKSLAVNDRQRIVKVSRKDSTVLSAVERINHEVTHVLQHENKRALGHLAILERVNLDFVSEQTESGGLWQEKVAHEAMSGTPDTDVNGTGYLSVLLVKARGGTFGEGVEAYFEDLARRNPKMAPGKVAAQAVNSTRRLFRAGGIEYAQESPYLTNTQPLNYLEQRLIYEGLSEEQRKLLFVGGVAINNLVKLARVGLVDLDAIQIPEQPPYVLLYPRVKDLLADKIGNDIAQ